MLKLKEYNAVKIFTEVIIKKFLIIILALLIFILVACGDNSNEEQLESSDQTDNLAVASYSIIAELEELDKGSLDSLFDWLDDSGSDRIREYFPHFPYVVMSNYDEYGNTLLLHMIASEIEYEFIRWRFEIDNDFYVEDGRTFIEGDALVIHSYYNVSEIEGALITTEDELIGFWAWINDKEWLYEFNADGTGFRGLESDLTAFTWELTSESELLIETTSGYDGREISERWRVRLDETDMLMLQSLHAIGMVHYYFKIE